MDWSSAFDFSVFATPEGWVSLVTLMFLEIVLGVDNLVFIAITTNRLPEDKQHIGRRLGLAGALLMRIIFLIVVGLLIHITFSLFTIHLGSYVHGVSIRDLILFAGGAYLIYKGIDELRDEMKLTEIKAEHCEEHKKSRLIALPQAILTIMVMDLVFSIDSVVTAAGLSGNIPIMVIAVMAAVLLMMVFIDQISNFINKNVEMKLLALFFIIAIGILLVMESLGIHIGIELLDMSLEKVMVYFAMVFAFIVTMIQMAYKKRLKAWEDELEQEQKDNDDIL